MKLSTVDFFLPLPVSIEATNLREYILANLKKKGQIIRWSIIDIKNSMELNDIKMIRIYAVLAN